jgi:hypothetical protein
MLGKLVYESRQNPVNIALEERRATALARGVQHSAYRRPARLPLLGSNAALRPCSLIDALPWQSPQAYKLSMHRPATACTLQTRDGGRAADIERPCCRGPVPGRQQIRSRLRIGVMACELSGAFRVSAEVTPPGR